MLHLSGQIIIIRVLTKRKHSEKKKKKKFYWCIDLIIKDSYYGFKS